MPDPPTARPQCESKVEREVAMLLLVAGCTNAEGVVQACSSFSNGGGDE